MYIPPYIVCAEAEDDVTENFKMKSVATTSKGKEMSAQERGSLVEECKKGFEEVARVYADDSTEALPRNAATNLGSESVRSGAQLVMEQAERSGLTHSPQRRIDHTAPLNLLHQQLSPRAHRFRSEIRDRVAWESLRRIVGRDSRQALEALLALLN